MALALYALTVAALYAVIAAASAATANALTIVFVALIVVPGCLVEISDRRRRGGKQ